MEKEILHEVAWIYKHCQRKSAERHDENTN